MRCVGIEQNHKSNHYLLASALRMQIFILNLFIRIFSNIFFLNLASLYHFYIYITATFRSEHLNLLLLTFQIYF